MLASFFELLFIPSFMSYGEFCWLDTPELLAVCWNMYSRIRACIYEVVPLRYVFAAFFRMVILRVYSSAF